MPGNLNNDMADSIFTRTNYGISAAMRREQRRAAYSAKIDREHEQILRSTDEEESEIKSEFAWLSMHEVKNRKCAAARAAVIRATIDARVRVQEERKKRNAALAAATRQRVADDKVAYERKSHSPEDALFAALNKKKEKVEIIAKPLCGKYQESPSANAKMSRAAVKKNQKEKKKVGITEGPLRRSYLKNSNANAPRPAANKKEEEKKLDVIQKSLCVHSKHACSVDDDRWGTAIKVTKNENEKNEEITKMDVTIEMDKTLQSDDDDVFENANGAAISAYEVEMEMTKTNVNIEVDTVSESNHHDGFEDAYRAAIREYEIEMEITKTNVNIEVDTASESDHDDGFEDAWREAMNEDKVENVEAMDTMEVDGIAEPPHGRYQEESCEDVSDSDEDDDSDVEEPRVALIHREVDESSESSEEE